MMHCHHLVTVTVIMLSVKLFVSTWYYNAASQIGIKI